MNLDHLYAPEPCKHHKPNNLRYLKWAEWSEAKREAGEVQSQCPDCGRWYFPEEIGEKPIT